ncbi:2Fe-2S ferredoxin-type domain-containing protein [Lanmaoa asiatica]|nr:2Fe-2S ferredoxin-type domain-containing protein [Lanmaoa asiatica]
MSVAVRILIDTTSVLGLRVSKGGSLLRDRSSVGSQHTFHHLLQRSLSPPLSTLCSFKTQNTLVQSRWLHVSSTQRHGSITRPAPGTGITLHFKDHKGTPIKTIEANEGDDILSLAHEWDIDLEGACEGSIACSTCHIILPPEHYDHLPEPSDDENDMLDLAFGLTDTSRLGCQVHITRDMDGMEIRLPSATRNMFVDGKKPTHH